MGSRALFILLYAASGAAALVYQVVWTRLLTLQMGHTAAAVSTVLAAFMGGLAVGAWLAGRFIPRLSRPLHTYATLEIFIALIAIVLPAALRLFIPFIAWAYADGDAPIRFALIRVTLGVVLLAVPAAAMGATFPIAASWFARLTASRTPYKSMHSAADTGVLYAANTAGAALGAIGAGFGLIPALGLRGTTWVGVGLNVAAALGALWLARREGTLKDIERPVAKRPRQAPRVALVPPQPKLAYVGAAVSGFSGLAYEVAFTRLLALIIGPTTYAFATMAASFISGIAIGSAAGARISRRVSQPALWLAAMIGGGAISALFAASYAASRLPLVVASQVTAADVTFQSVVLRQAFGVSVLMLPMTFALGAAFPLALATAASGPAAVGRDSASVYAANTLGAIAGALAAGFVLVPLFGLRATFVGMSVAGTLGGSMLGLVALTGRTARKGLARRVVAGVAAGVAALAILINTASWDPDLLASGAYKYAPYISASNVEDFRSVLRAGRLEYYKEGAAATVSVRRLGGTLSLAIDGKVDASNAGDMLTQRLLGVLPVLLHHDPEDVLVIGLGSGVTVSSALATGLVTRADVVEISPEVVEASALFSKENGKVLQAPNLRLVVGDGRSHLLLSPRQYDVIVSEPSNPWMAGVPPLFTREFFEAARARLKPDGILCQWAHTYDISDSDLRSIARTFASVFPEGTMWLVGDGDLLLIGTAGGGIEERLANLVDGVRIRSATTVLADVGVIGDHAAFQLTSLYAGGPAELVAFGNDASIQTDDRMALEFTAPRSIYGRAINTHSAAIRSLTAGRPLPPPVDEPLRRANAQSWTARGTMLLKAEAYTAAYASFRRAVELDSEDPEALRGVSDAAGGAQRQSEHRAWLEALARDAPDNAAARVELSRALAAAAEFDKAIAAASEARRLRPADPLPAEQLASVFADMGDVNRLRPLADTLVGRFPDRDDSRYYHAVALLLEGRTAEAAEQARRLLGDSPQYGKAQNLLGTACAALKEHECARQAFEASIRLNPEDPSSHINLGVFYLESSNAAAAADAFAEALALDPASKAARSGLAQARMFILDSTEADLYSGPADRRTAQEPTRRR